MKYACLVYLKESEITALTQGEWDALNNECMAFGETRVGSRRALGRRGARADAHGHDRARSQRQG